MATASARVARERPELALRDLPLALISGVLGGPQPLRGWLDRAASGLPDQSTGRRPPRRLRPSSKPTARCARRPWHLGHPRSRARSLFLQVAALSSAHANQLAETVTCVGFSPHRFDELPGLLAVAVHDADRHARWSRCGHELASTSHPGPSNSGPSAGHSPLAARRQAPGSSLAGPRRPRGCFSD